MLEITELISISIHILGLQCDSLAAVWVNHVRKELHSYNCEGIVEDDEGQTQTGHPGEELEHGVQHVTIPLLYLKQPGSEGQTMLYSNQSSFQLSNFIQQL